MTTDKTEMNTVEAEEEWAKMLRGELYNAANPVFFKKLMEVRKQIKLFNDLMPEFIEEQQAILRGLLGSCPKQFHINQPFRCDFGCNIHIDENFFANFNLTILDEAKVTIGRNVFIGPNVSIYTACHPLGATLRATGAEWAEPVTIGDDVWIGGNAVILPGVTIGSRCVIGAGSVVTKDIPPQHVAAGSPARIIRHIDEI